MAKYRVLAEKTIYYRVETSKFTEEELKKLQDDCEDVNDVFSWEEYDSTSMEITYIEKVDL